MPAPIRADLTGSAVLKVASSPFRDTLGFPGENRDNQLALISALSRENVFRVRER